jgi:hypothetical protein
VSAHAQKRYSLGTSINLTGGVTNTLNGFAITQVPTQKYLPSYGAFPMITLTTKGEHSELDTSYSYGFNRVGKHDLNEQSHAGSFSLSKTLNPRWTTGLSDHFVSSVDASAFNALRNVFSDPTTTIFVFSPVTSRITTRSNTASFSASDQYTDRSSLSFSLAHTLLDYGSGNGSSGLALQNQQQIAGNLAYNHKTGQHETWTLGYSASFFTFSQSQNGFSQSALAGYSTNVLRDFTLSITAGISEITEGNAGSSTGLNSSASLARAINKNSSFQLHFTQSSGGAAGLGTFSNTRQAGLSLNHSGRHLNEFLDVSAFNMHGILGNTFSQRGVSGTASLGLALSKQWSAQAGAFYQAYDHTSTFAFTEKRVFVSLRYNNPNLWTGSSAAGGDGAKREPDRAKH